MTRLDALRIQRGLTLIENLVALLLLSFALLGLAGLMGRTLGREKESVYHSLASVMAQDIAEKVRTNRGVFNTYINLLNAPTSSPASKSCSAGGFGKVTTPVACTPAQLAEDDAYNWRRWVATSLPGGVGIVCRDNTPDDGTDTNPACDGGARVAIKIFWRDAKGGGRASATPDTELIQRFVTTFQP